MKVTVLGTGGWGLSLGQVVYENKNEVMFWTNSQAEVDLLSTEHQYKDKLPGVIFPADFKYTTDMNAALDGCQCILWRLKKNHRLGVSKTDILGNFTHLLDRYTMSLNSWRSCFHNHPLTKIIMSNTVRNCDDSVGTYSLCPACGNLTMKKSGVNTCESNLDLAVAKYSSRRDCTCGSAGCCCRCLGSCLLRL